MVKLEPPCRYATPDDAPALAELANEAAEGMPLYMWSKRAEKGQDPWEIGMARAKREEGGYSYRHAVVYEEDEQVVAALIGYPLPDAPPARNYDDMPAMYVPLQELEDAAPGTWYVNFIAAYPAQRGRGYGTTLLDIGERLAADAGKRGVSLIVSDANAGARRFYERHGYSARKSRPIIKEDWETDGADWLLYIKPL
jgi:ribosomal protein S18 acetylase RimI-like enzyme